jgi:hypothetical protein
MRASAKSKDRACTSGAFYALLSMVPWHLYFTCNNKMMTVNVHCAAYVTDKYQCASDQLMHCESCVCPACRRTSSSSPLQIWVT